LNNICVIGIGTLGGFLSKCISDLEETKEICIIDYDTIEEKNLLNSIYREEYLGQYKVDALEKIIKNNNKGISVIKLNQRYIEGETILPKRFDLVLDCRDFTYDRSKEIDARMYITGRTLIVDCRKEVQYNNHIEGKYTSFLSTEGILIY
jgi:tRNA A37 threonylcarbamoyladenosine dehydratase